MRDDSEDLRRVGRDEMNLCEFPIATLADWVPPGIKTMVFEDRHGKLTVSGSDDYGLPAAPDSDVIVGLIQLTKLRNDFTDPTVEFSRYELLKLLGWPDQKHYYQRLTESLHRWVGVTLRYDGTWWDNRRKRRVDASFHILECVILPDKNDPMIESSFTWNKIFFKSCRDGNLKRLDLDTYFALKSAISKQLYRFLDKRFYVRRDLTFDLRELAHERIGMSRKYAPWKIKQELQPALDELEEVGFLEPMTAAERYSKAARRGTASSARRSDRSAARARSSRWPTTPDPCRPRPRPRTSTKARPANSRSNHPQQEPHNAMRKTATSATPTPTPTTTTTSRPPRGGRRPRPLGPTRRALRRRGSPHPPRAPRRAQVHHRPRGKAEAQRRPRTGELVLPDRAGRPLGALLAHDHLARRPRRHAGSYRRLPRHARRGGPRQGRR